MTQQQIIKPNFSDISYLRICLFNNATTEELLQNKNSYRLTVGVKKGSSPDFMNFNFAMNTKGSWVLNRGKVAELGLIQDEHYQTILRNYQAIKKMDTLDPEMPPRMSKAYMPIAGQSTKTPIPFVTAILWSENQTYWTNIMFGDTSFFEELSTKGLTAAERKSNMIAKTVWTKTGGGVFDWSKTSWV